MPLMMRSSLNSSTPLTRVSSGGAVADDGGLVGAVDDLVELVGDNNGGQALLLKRNEQVQQHLGILVVEGGRRLVQDEQLYLLGEGLGDFHQLLLAGTDVLDQGLGRLIESHLLHVALGLIIGLVPVDDPILLRISLPRNMFSPMESRGIRASSW